MSPTALDDRVLSLGITGMITLWPLVETWVSAPRTLALGSQKAMMELGEVQKATECKTIGKGHVFPVGKAVMIEKEITQLPRVRIAL
jgi:hypothetical protein